MIGNQGIQGGSSLGGGAASRATNWVREALARERTLTVFALVMSAAMLPTMVAYGLDDRSLRGVSVWAKPLKFMASIGLFSFSTAWFFGLLPAARRRAASLRLAVWVIVIASLFEIGYITFQAALGQASHFNFSSPLHLSLYTAMGLAAMAMTATQPLLAWHIARHGHADTAASAPWRQAVVIGLVLTFLFGAGAGGLLGGMQPPAGAGLPVVGWHASGDLRPAHFLGMHAQQFFPLVALLLVGLNPGAGIDAQQSRRRLLWVFAGAFSLLWVVAMLLGLQGAQMTLPVLQPSPG